MDVLAAVDKSKQRANEQANLLTMFPGAADITVHICHVFEENTEGTSISRMSSVRQMENQLQEAGIEYEYRSRTGDPVEKIFEVADEYDVDALCLSGRKRSAAGKVLFGSVTQSVVLRTDRPVMIAGERETAAMSE
jgi:nucleotide-binding universal stress UspA family protein